MPTFKANFAQFNPRADVSENMQTLFAEHNAFVSKVSRTLNNLDEDNFTQSLIDTLKGDDDTE